MPNIAPITIKGGEATPVDHVYVPSNVNGSNIVLVERVSSMPFGDPTLAWNLRGPTPGVDTVKLTIKMVQPVLVTGTDASGKTVTFVDHSPLCAVDFVASQKSTKAQRLDQMARIANAMQTTYLKQVWGDIEGGW